MHKRCVTLQSFYRFYIFSAFTAFAAMNPFIHLPRYLVIVCNKCKYAVLPSQIDTHLKNKKKYRYSKEERQIIIQEVVKIPGLIQGDVLLEAFQFPPKTAVGIPKLKAPRRNGLKCRSCEYVICHPRSIQEHCRAVHGWENERKTGWPSYKKR
jgi:hypothetical protein